MYLKHINDTAVKSMAVFILNITHDIFYKLLWILDYNFNLSLTLFYAET